MQKLVFILLINICATGLLAQEYPDFINDKGSEKESSIVYYRLKDKFDFIIAKSETCYWYEKIHYEIIGYKNGKIKKILLIQNKKNGKIKSKKIRISRKDNRDYSKMLVDMNSIGFFQLINRSLNIQGRDNGDGTRTVINISDGHNYIFEIIKNKNYKKIYSYCPEIYLKQFPNMKKRKLFLDCLNIYKSYWKKK